MSSGMNVKEFAEDMETIILDVKDQCSPVILLTSIYYKTSWKSFPPWNKGSKKLTEIYNDTIQKLALKNNCIFSDVWESENGADWLINPDGVHANFLGNLIIGHRVFRDIAVNCSCLSNSTFERTINTQWVKDTSKIREECGDPFKKTW
jgi:hypothetical protein